MVLMKTCIKFKQKFKFQPKFILFEKYFEFYAMLLVVIFAVFVVVPMLSLILQTLPNEFNAFCEVQHIVMINELQR
jgi:hypothetical protein